MNSNVAVRSNLMLDDEQHKPNYRYIPGDYVGKIYPELTDTRVSWKELTPLQLVEMRQYLICIRCQRPCAGTCDR